MGVVVQGVAAQVAAAVGLFRARFDKVSCEKREVKSFYQILVVLIFNRNREHKKISQENSSAIFLSNIVTVK